MTIRFNFDKDDELEIEDYEYYALLTKEQARELYEVMRKHYGDKE